MSAKLFLDLHSQPCRAVVLFCRMNGIALGEQNVSFVSGETRSEWFLRLNPMHHVPVLQDGDFVLTESAAILRYLSKKYNCPDHWNPPDLHQGASVDEFIMWLYCGYGLRTAGSNVFIEQALRPHRTGTSPRPDAVEERTTELAKTLDLFEVYSLKDHDYIGGCGDVSLADLLAICELMQPMSVGYDVTSGRARLKAWFDRTKARLQPHFDDVHRDILKFGSDYKLSQ